MTLIRNYSKAAPLLALFVGLFAQVASGQNGSLTLSSASTTAGGTVSLNLDLNSPAGSAPAAMQWTLTYPAASVANISASAGSAVTAAGDTVTCGPASGSYKCIASGMNANTIANGTVAVVSVTLAAAAGSTSIAVANTMGVSPSSDAISLSGNPGTITVTQPVTITLSTLGCTPTMLSASASATCTVTLTAPAPAGGVVVSLSDNNTSLSTPASVTVPAGSTTATFTVTASSISSDQTATITASYNGVSRSMAITLSAPVLLTSLQCAPTSLQSGAVAACTFGLSKAAPSGGLSIAVSDNCSVLTVPGSVTVAAGAMSGSFNATVGTVASAQTAVVTAALNGSSSTVSLSLSATPAVTVSALACSPTTLASGASSTCTVTLSANAPSGGLTVSLSDNSSILTVPASVSVAASSASTTFLAIAGTASTSQSATITATLNSSSRSVSLTISPASATCPCSVWLSTAQPINPASTDTKSTEVGVKFRSDVAGYVTGVRFYKGSTNTGTHVGHLWTSSGTLLASVTFLNESASGWQLAYFPAPIAVSANTVYVISYLAPKGHYAADMGFFTNNGVNRAPLHALADGQIGPDGVYQYGANVFPTTSSSGTNYWVDVVFNNTPVIGTGAPLSLWTSTAGPKVTSVNQHDNPVELGVKIRSDVAGYATGMRFFKISPDTGTHVGHLWNTAGTLLGTVTFTNEIGPSGWQQANFATPIAITANTTYVVSYWSPQGYYAEDDLFFATSGVNTQTLHALVDGQDGPNSVYRYGSSSGYPTTTYQSCNYWIDLVFTSTPQ